MFKNKFSKFIVSGLLASLTFSFFSIPTNANTTLPYKKINKMNYINIMDLANLKKELVVSASHAVYGEGTNITFDGKLISIYDEAPYIFIDGRMIAIKTETVKAGKIEYQFPILEKPKKENNDYLIPSFVLTQNLDIEYNSEGIILNDLKE